MRIAIFSSGVEPRDGYGNITFELCSHLKERGVDFVLFLPRSQEQHCQSKSLPFETRCALPPYIFRIYQPAGLRYFLPIELEGFDLVHSLFAFPYCIVARAGAAKHKLPFMMGAQGTHGVRPLTHLPERWLMKRCYRQSRAITTPSNFTREKIMEYAGEHYDINVIHNGVNFERFQKQLDLTGLRDRYRGKKILLTVGGLWGRKGHDLVLRALAIVANKREDILYLIVGDGNARPQLETLVQELGLQNHVEFLGQKSGDDLVSYFQLCDIYVHTPKVVDLKFEGFGIVYLEASACGKPVVATDAGGIRDAVIENETGLIAPDGDIEGVANRIMRLLDDPDLAHRLGERGRTYARENDWAKIADQFEALYRSIDEQNQ